MVLKYLLGENVHYEHPGGRVILPLLKKGNGVHENSRICSLQCQLWGNCPLQKGGLPCRMPEEEFEEKVARMGKREAVVV